MATEILRPQDCLIQRIRVSPCRRTRNCYAYNTSPSPNSNPRFNRKQAAVRSERTDQRKRQPEQSHQHQNQHQPLISRRSNSVDELKISKYYGNNKGNSSSNLVMEKVTILRRGESVDSKIKSTETTPFSKKDGEFVVTGTDRLGPDPEMVPKQIRMVDFRSPVSGKCDVYAGSGFAVSPAPSSLPLPSFSKKKQVRVDDSATRDLRRLLRLDV